MGFTVTALKWRPQKFEEVVGQEHITKTLKNAIANGRIAHAYIFAGPRGVGKTTTARILAKRLNCLNPQGGEPCNECKMCKMFQSGQTMDVMEIDGASNRRIDEIRNLRESVKYAPTAGKYKIYIIDEVHMLTNEAFNALLKTLEEPPEHTVFIFATTDIHKVPLTIISRCQRFDFRRIELGEIKKQLGKIAKEEKIEIDDESLTIIAKKADGALRDAQSLFDQVVSYCGTKINVEEVSEMLNLIDEEVFFKISEAVLNKNFAVAYETAQTLYENGWNFIDFVMGLIEHFRNIMTVAVTGSSKLIEASESTKLKYEALKNNFSEPDLLRILSFLTNLLTDVKTAQNQRLTVEIGLSKLIGLERSVSISALIEALKRGDFPLPAEPKNEANKTEEKPVTEIRKEEIVREPETSHYTADLPKEATEKPEEKAPLDLKSIRAKWHDFVKEINSRKFAVGSRLYLSEPLDFSNGVLQVEINEKEDLKFLEERLDFIHETFENFYGSRAEIKFVATENPVITKDEENNANENEENKFVKGIIEKLGGKEIK